MKLLDIVIPVYGRFDLLDRCIKAILASDTPFGYNVILVDNNSPDQVEAKEFYSQYEHNTDFFIKRNKENQGFPRACNYGARRKSSPLILFLNSDAFVNPNTLQLLVKELDDPDIGIVGTKLIFPEGIPNPNFAGKVQHVGVSLNVHGVAHHPLLGWEPNHKRVLAIREIFAVTGALLMTRRNLFQSINGFDEQYGGGTFDDLDYCMAVRTAGKKIILNQDAWCYHYANASAMQYKVGFPMEENRAKFLMKWKDKLFYSDPLYY